MAALQIDVIQPGIARDAGARPGGDAAPRARRPWRSTRSPSRSPRGTRLAAGAGAGVRRRGEEGSGPGSPDGIAGTRREPRGSSRAARVPGPPVDSSARSSACASPVFALPPPRAARSRSHRGRAPHRRDVRPRWRVRDPRRAIPEATRRTLRPWRSKIERSKRPLVASAKSRATAPREGLGLGAASAVAAGAGGTPTTPPGIALSPVVKMKSFPGSSVPSAELPAQKK